MLRSIGAETLALRWGGLASQAMTDWLYYGRMSWPYLLLGVGAYLQLVLALPWVIFLLVRSVVSHLRWE